MPYTPSAAAQSTAALAGSNMASLTTPLTALQTSIAGGNLAPAAYLDAALSAVGFQLEQNITLGTASTASSTLASVPSASFTFTASIAKTYLVHCDFGCFASAVTGFQLAIVVNGSAGPTVSVCMPAAGTTAGFHLMHSAACIAGTNTITVQWAIASAATLSTNGLSYANYIVTG